MMKFSPILHTALAGMLVIPAVTLQGGVAGSLEETLTSTVRALESLAGIQTRLEASDPAAVSDVLALTEPPLELPESENDPSAKEKLLERLRDDVNRLQSELDQEPVSVTSAGFTGSPRARPSNVAGTTGLDDSMRRRLAVGPAHSPENAIVIAGTTKTAAQSEAPRAFEAEGYSADVMRLARVLYRQARYEEAIDELAVHLDSSTAAYWTARCLEKLGRTQDAIDTYERVIAMADGSPDARRAQEDVDFLRWRVEFERTTQNGRKDAR